MIEIFKLADVEYRMSGSDPLGILREQSQSSMADLKRSTPDSETHILEGSPRPLIVEFALESDCQMIVMGTQGRSGLAQLFLGSVAEYVVRHSKVPVLTIRTWLESVRGGVNDSSSAILMLLHRRPLS